MQSVDAAVSVLAAHATAAAAASDTVVQCAVAPAASVQLKDVSPVGRPVESHSWPSLDLVYCRVGLQSAVSIVILFVLAMNPYVKPYFVSQIFYLLMPILITSATVGESTRQAFHIVVGSCIGSLVSWLTLLMFGGPSFLGSSAALILWAFVAGYLQIDHTARRMWVAYLCIVLLNNRVMTFGNLLELQLENAIGLAVALGVCHVIFPRYACVGVRQTLSHTMTHISTYTRLVMQGADSDYRFHVDVTPPSPSVARPQAPPPPLSKRCSLAPALRQLDGDIRQGLLTLDSMIAQAKWEATWLVAPLPSHGLEECLNSVRAIFLHLQLMDAALEQGISQLVYDRMIVPLLPLLADLAVHFTAHFLGIGMHLIHADVSMDLLSEPIMDGPVVAGVPASSASASTSPHTSPPSSSRGGRRGSRQLPLFKRAASASVETDATLSVLVIPQDDDGSTNETIQQPTPRTGRHTLLDEGTVPMLHRLEDLEATYSLSRQQCFDDPEGVGVGIVSHASDLAALTTFLLSLRVVTVKTLALREETVAWMTDSHTRPWHQRCLAAARHAGIGWPAVVANLDISSLFREALSPVANGVSWWTAHAQQLQFGFKFALAVFVPALLILWPWLHAQLAAEVVGTDAASVANQDATVQATWRALFQENVLWVPLTSALVMDFSVGAAVRRAINRMVGTVAGCAFGYYSVVWISNSPVWIAFITFTLTGVCCYVKKYPSLGYGAVICAVTVVLVVTQDVSRSSLVALRRCALVLLGNLFALGVNGLVFPLHASAVLPVDVAESLEMIAQTNEAATHGYLSLDWAVAPQQGSSPSFQPMHPAAVVHTTATTATALRARWAQHREVAFDAKTEWGVCSPKQWSSSAMDSLIDSAQRLDLWFCLFDACLTYFPSDVSHESSITLEFVRDVVLQSRPSLGQVQQCINILLRQCNEALLNQSVEPLDRLDVATQAAAAAATGTPWLDAITHAAAATPMSFVSQAADDVAPPSTALLALTRLSQQVDRLLSDTLLPQFLRDHASGGSSDSAKGSESPVPPVLTRQGSSSNGGRLRPSLNIHMTYHALVFSVSRFAAAMHVLVGHVRATIVSS